MKETMSRLRCKTQPHRNQSSEGSNAVNPLFENTSVEELLSHPLVLQNLEIDSFNQSRFAIRHLDPSFSITPSIANNPSYLAILQLIKQFNEETLHLVDREHRAFHSKKEVMDVVMNMLRIMMLSSSSDTKNNILDLTLAWLQKQLQLKLKRPQQQQPSARRTKLKRTTQHQTSSSQTLQEETEDFKRKLRTEYKDRDSAKEQLKDYVKRRIQLLREPSPAQKAKDKLKRVAFKKQERSQNKPASTEQQSEGGPSKEEEIKDQVNTMETNPYTETIGEPPLLPQEAKLLPENVQQQDQLFGEKPENSFPQNQQASFNETQQPLNAQEDEYGQNEGELDPKRRAYTSSIIPPSVPLLEKERASDLSTIALEQQSKALKKMMVRQDEDIVKRMQMWAGCRSKFKKELSRKIESSRLFFKENQPSRQNRWNQFKINQAVKEGKQTLKGEFQSESCREREPGLSVYCRVRPKVGSTRSAKTLEVILRENSRERQGEKGMQQVAELKEKLSSKKVFASLSMLKNSLICPSDQELPVLTVRVERPLDLLSNPLGKKKRKKRAVQS